MLLDEIRKGNTVEVRSLLAADPSLRQTRTPEGASAVLWCVYTGHAELAPLVLGERPPDFWEACALGDAARVEAMLKEDAGRANAAAPDGYTPLGFAAYFGHAEVARVLLEGGADPSQPSANKMRFTPLHSAVAANAGEIVAMLLEAGADANARDAQGNTPLHSAAGQGNGRVSWQLRAAGADTEARNDEGKTPADIAEANGQAVDW